MVKGLKNAYLMHFSSLYSWFHCRGCYYLKCSSSLSQSLCKGQIKGKKTFFGQNSFQLMYNHKPKSNAPLRKNHKTADRIPTPLLDFKSRTLLYFNPPNPYWNNFELDPPLPYPTLKTHESIDVHSFQ